MTDEPVIERHVPRVINWASGLHWPRPVQKADGWRCADCGRRLSRYWSGSSRRFRHNPRDRG